MAARRPYTVAYEPPSSDFDIRPRVIVWYRVYAAFMLFLAFAFAVGAGFIAWAQTRPEVAVLRGSGEAQTQAMLLVLLGVGLVIFYSVATFLPLKPWGWTFGLVVIALGLTTPLIIATLPMFLAWNKPLVKAAFCRI